MFTTFYKKVSYGALLLCVFLLAGCGGTTITIEGPIDGSFLSGDTIEINLNYSGAESSELSVQLNGIEIVGSLTMSGKDAIGESPELLSGINVLRVTLKDKIVISRFVNLPQGLPTNLTPLYTQKVYNDLVDTKYDSKDHQDILDQIKSGGLSTNIVTPYEVIDNDASILMAILQDSDAPEGELVGVVSVNVTEASVGTYATSYGFKLKDSCILEVFDKEGSETINRCLTSAGFPSLESNNILTHGIPYPDLIMHPLRSSALGCLAKSKCGGSLKSLVTTWLGLSIGCLIATKNPVACSIIGGIALPIDIDDFIGCALDNCMPAAAGSTGDPHLTTLDGVYYDNQLIGEFMLLREKTQDGLEIQTRQQAFSEGSCATLNTSVAIRLDGDIVEFQVKDKLVIVNGSPVVIANNETLILPGGATITTENGWKYYTTTKSGNVIHVVLHGIFVNIRVRLLPSYSQTVEGLLGNFDGDKNNDLTLRNGNVVWDIDTFNEDWRIKQEESLFTYSDGSNTDTYTEINNCELSPSSEYIDSANSLYEQMCGTVPTPNDPLVNAIAIDLSAGLSQEEVSGWLENHCIDGSILTPVTDWNELYANFSGTWETSGFISNLMYLAQDGTSVSGTFQTSAHTFQGTVEKNVFTGVLVNQSGGGALPMTFTLSEDGQSLEGVWQSNIPNQFSGIRL